MLIHSFDIKLIDQWFEHGKESDYNIIYRELTHRFFINQDIRQALGDAVVQEVRQEVLMKLLDRDARRLWGKREPLAYAWVVWRRSLTDILRVWRKHQEKNELIQQYVSAALECGERAPAETNLDAERAIKIAADLKSTGRVAVLLTVRPDHITADDWQELSARHPPPPPLRPSAPLDREDACDLIYPPQEGESAEQRYQRLNNFDQSYKRALKKIRSAMESER
jgi:hypothetical protein